jgi:sulfite exporter TauE/SafE
MIDANALIIGDVSWTPIVAGLLFGTVHACDPDHVMTVTSMARHGSNSRHAVLGYGMRWSLGHALSLICIGTLLAAGGWSLPWMLGAAAETLVAIALCGLGLYLLREASRRPLGAVFHGALRARAQRIPSRGVVCLGSLHGLAGAAPIFALMPLAHRLDPWFACAYLLCFSLGVILAMLVIASLLSSANARVQRYGARLENILNGAVGCGALVIGVFMVITVLQ